MNLLSRLAAVVFGVTLLQGAVAQAPPTLAISAITVVDTINGRTLANRTVVIRNGSIVSITPGDAAPAGAQRVDGRGKFLIPGLWDMHAHHQLTGEASLPLFVATGVTGTRDMGADLDFILPLRERVASGALLGPTIIASGPILDDSPPEWPFRIRVQNAEEARKAVQLLKERGVDFIKVHTSTPAAAYSAIAEEARRLNLTVAGHLPRAVTLEQAVASGQRSIEHLDSFRLFSRCSGGTMYAADKCTEFFKTLAKNGTWQTPTLVNWRKMFTLGTPQGDAEEDHYAYASPGMREFLKINREMSRVTPAGALDMVSMSDTAAIAVSDMQKAGVPMLAGCDGMVAGFCLHDELVLMVRGGMSAAAALQTATINPARYLKLESTLGSVDVGKKGDLVLLDGNPLEDIKNIDRIHAVIIRGRLLTREDLDGILERARTEFSQ